LLEAGQVIDQGSYEELARRHEHLRLIERQQRKDVRCQGLRL
jgi:hypothetical protein